MEDESRIFGLGSDRLARLWEIGSDISGTTSNDAAGVIEGPGTTIGQYKLLELIGEGGMGLVYLAEQEELVKRRVALKIIKPGMDSKRVIGRFEAEREVLALLNHPNIARVFDAGTTETGRPYFVMEYVKGMPITKYCDRHKLSIEQRLRLFLRVCHGVQHAHQKGIIHRDIKPFNILVSIQDDAGLPKVIDFGIAKAVTQPSTEQTLFTRHGQLLGTPEYMSPEQVDMANQDIDTRADIYSLGVVLYELLTGVLPFEHDVLKQASMVEVQRIIRVQNPPRPSTRLSNLGGEAAMKVAQRRRAELGPLVKRLHKELEWIPMMAMRKERTQRYQTASDLADDIQNYLSGAPLIAGPESTVYRVKKLVRRHRVSVAAIAAVAASVVVGFIISTFMYFRAEQQRDLAQKQTEAYRRALYTNNITIAAEAYSRANISRTNEYLTLCPADLRGWEWDYLRRISDQADITLRGHKGSVRSVTFSARGKHIASGSADHTIRIWDASSGAQVATFSGHMGSVRCVSFSPDGRLLASGSEDNTIKVWDVMAGTEIATLQAHKADVQTVIFSPDGKHIASGSEDKTIKIWNVETGDEVITLHGHESDVMSTAFSPDGKRLVSGSEDRAVKVWNVKTGAEMMTLRGHRSNVRSVAFSPDGSHIASGCEDTTIKIWNATTGAEVMTFLGHQSSVTSVAFGPSGGQIISGSSDNTIKLWDATRGSEVMTLRGHESEVMSVASSPDGKHAVSGSDDNTIKLWNTVAGKEALVLKGHRAGIICVTFSPDSKQIATGGSDGRIKVWDVSRGCELITMRGHQRPVTCVAFSPDGRRVLSGSFDNMAKVWDAATGDELMTLRGHDGDIRCLAFSPNGKRIISGDWDCVIKLWDAVTGSEVMTFRGQTGPIVSVVFTADGKRIVSGSADSTVKVWDAATGAQLMNLQGHRKAVYSVWASPDDRYIISGSGIETIMVWDLATGKQVRTLLGRKRSVGCVALSPDGKRAASGGLGNPIIITDVETGDELMTLHEHPTEHPTWSFAFHSFAFSPDGRAIAISSGGTIKLLESSVPAGSSGLRETAEAARRAVDRLYREYGFYHEVIEQLRADKAIAEPVRSIALQIANSRLLEDTEKLNRVSWDLVSSPDRDVELYHRALDMAEKAHRLELDNRAALNTLGVAQYRTGAYHDALDSLTRSGKMRTQISRKTAVANVAFAAMTLYKLERHHDAQTALNRLRYLFEDRSFADRRHGHRFLFEAEKLFAGSNTKLHSIWGLIEVGKLDKAVERLEELRSVGQQDAELDKRTKGAAKWLGRAYYNRVKEYRLRGLAYAEMIEDLEAVIRIDPDNAPACNELAWLLATCREPGLRDNARAVKQATNACELTKWKEFDYVSTLAAACSEAGEFATAAKWQKKAIELLPENRRDERQANYQVRLRLYQSGKAYHEGGWAENPIAWWKFDETSGSVAKDASGKGYDSVALYGQPIWEADGKFGGCINFDETYGLLMPKDVFSTIDKAVTISVWIKGDSDQPLHSNVIVQAGHGVRGIPYILTVHTQWHQDGELEFSTGDDKRIVFNAVPDQWAGTWNHYAFTIDADQGFQRIYHNGELVAEERGTHSSMAGIGTARIGVATDREGDQHIGRLDDLRIYNYALSEAEIKALCAGKSVAAAKQ
jgi:WD40 repeat protein/serine/threonine protein kinase